MKNRMFLIFLSLIPAFGIAREYYASNAADIYALINTIQPGDTVTMNNGIWKDQPIVFHAEGTEELPILLRAEEPGYVRITGNSYLEFSGSWITVDGLLFRDGYCNSGQGVIEFRSSYGKAYNCRLTNTAIVDYNPDNKNTDYKWVSMYGKNNRVDHCHFEGKQHSGTTLVVWLSSTADRENYHRIDHNYFGPRPELGYNGGETIRIGTSDYSMSNSYTTVEYNVFEECSGETEIISNKSCENIYQYNTFINCEGCLTLRHGNRCTVRGNFFFGNRSGDTGGVRIIGEDHQVYNNYFDGLNGSGYSSALCIVKGVQDSPLNRYFQVKRAKVIFNTFINCRNTFLIGYGTSDDQNLPPTDCIIANNAIQTDNQVARIGDTEGTPVNFLWEGNIFYGSSLGISDPGGVTWQNPDLTLADDEIFRPTSSSPLIDASVGDYSNITTDMDGQPRAQPYDVGCDEMSSEPIVNVPLKRQDVDVDWYIGPVAVEVTEGENTLSDALNLLSESDTLKLITDGGIYQLSDKIIVDRKLIIRAAKGLVNPPVITRSQSNSIELALFEMWGLGELDLDGVILDGNADCENELSALIATSESAFSEYFRIKANHCQFNTVHKDSSGNLLKLFPGTQADSIIFHNCIFSNSDGDAIKADGEEEGSGNYNVKYLELYNCTFWNIGGRAVSIYAGDDIIYTLEPIIRIDHCTFDDCGSPIINLREVDNGIITNSIFSNSPSDTASVIIYGWSYIEYCDIFNSGPVQLERGAHQYNKMINLDPKYADPSSGNFTLAYSSPVRGIAKDNEAMGDLRWAVAVENSVWSSESNHIQGFELYQNYPNPFNNATRISFSLSKPATIELQIFNLNGTQVAQMRGDYYDAGNYSITWKPEFISSGVYFCRLITGDNSKIIKMMYLK